MGCHSWVVSTDNEHGYESELRGITSGLSVIGTLAISGKIKVRYAKQVCDNYSSIKARKRTHKQNVFHITECNHDVISTIYYFQESWCQNIDIQYEWERATQTT
jgi:hypothetical protein